ncbi:uncharacterized protein LOC143918258 [Arctopsyche grandis]|uniref:uncharacterized protein LOC143918258 n=1 Tax=Arctopsyche grandis TaxID=121162 RepID=UPI00406D8241
MECRLCLCSLSAESSIPIYENLDLRAKHIRSCCQIQVKKYDNLPDTICSTCESNLDALFVFKNMCIQNDKEIRLTKCLDIKVEEVLLDDLVWENEPCDPDSMPYDEKRTICLNENDSEQIRVNEINLQSNLEKSIPNIELSMCEEQCDNVGKRSLMKKKKTILNHCTVCSKNFVTNIAFKIHMRFHTEENLFKCKICSKCFVQNCELKLHMKYHNGKKSFKCVTCSKLFVRNGELLRHMRLHTGEKSFKCQSCPKCFARKYELILHTKRHSGNKPFKCEICSKGFGESRYLKLHMKYHTGEKSYICDVCSKSFVQRGNLELHLKRHNGEKSFKCELCSKCFVRNAELLRHMKYHNAKKPFQCKVCSKCFSQKNRLNLHLNCHDKNSQK